MFKIDKKDNFICCDKCGAVIGKKIINKYGILINSKGKTEVYASADKVILICNSKRADPTRKKPCRHQTEIKL